MFDVLNKINPHKKNKFFFTIDFNTIKAIIGQYINWQQMYFISSSVCALNFVSVFSNNFTLWPSTLIYHNHYTYLYRFCWCSSTFAMLNWCNCFLLSQVAFFPFDFSTRVSMLTRRLYYYMANTSTHTHIEWWQHNDSAEFSATSIKRSNGLEVISHISFSSLIAVAISIKSSHCWRDAG